ARRTHPAYLLEHHSVWPTLQQEAILPFGAAIPVIRLWTTAIPSGMVTSVLRKTFRGPRILVSLVTAFMPCISEAALHAIGHEFRPTAEQHTRAFACPAADGVTGYVVYRCQESSPGHCPDPASGTLYVEWRSADGSPV